MHALPLLDELAVVAAVAVAVALVLARLHLPTVAGLLAAGAVVGPFGLKLARSVSAIEVLAEVGVVLLLFSIGLEFSLTRLKHIFRQVALGGAIQVGLTTLVTVVAFLVAGEPLGRTVFFGFAFALSSTAIVLRGLGERRELDAPHGRFIVGTLLFQDLCVVPMVLIVPLLGNGAPAGGAGPAIALALGKAALVVVGTVAVARLLVPRIFHWVDASRSREVFLLAILALCIGTAWLTYLAGLSLALGAFLGGMIVADTEYGHRAMGDILPLRDAFVSLFFVSLGMLFDVRVVWAEPWRVLLYFVGFVFVKGALATAAAMAMRFPARVAWLAGVGLAQFGEFGFVLTRLAETSSVVDPAQTAPLLAAGILSMFLTPVLVRVAPHVRAGERLLAPLERLIGVRSIEQADATAEVGKGHVLLVGFGVAGRLVARTLTELGERFVGLELNADNVRKAKALGLPFYYGDATSEEALWHAHLESARLVVLLINDAHAAERVVATIRRVAPKVPVLMRARYLLERDKLLKLGASDVIAEEVEGAVEAVARMLRWLGVPGNAIDERVRAIRAETKTTDRRQVLPTARLGHFRELGDLRVESAIVGQKSKAAHASPASLNLRSDTGALAIGIRRAGELLDGIDAHAPFLPGDVVYLVGSKDALARAFAVMANES